MHLLATTSTKLPSWREGTAAAVPSKLAAWTSQSASLPGGLGAMHVVLSGAVRRITSYDCRKKRCNGVDTRSCILRGIIADVQTAARLLEHAAVNLSHLLCL